MYARRAYRTCGDRRGKAAKLVVAGYLTNLDVFLPLSLSLVRGTRVNVTTTALDPFMDAYRSRLLDLIEGLRTTQSRLLPQGRVSDSEILWLIERIKVIYADWIPMHDDSSSSHD